MGSPRILVAEDDSFLATLIRQVLEDDKMDVKIVDNGARCVECVSVFQPDVIIMDAMMPVMTGFDALRHLKSDPVSGRIPVLMLTGRRSIEDVQIAIKDGASDYMTKPFRPDHLVQRVRRLLEHVAGTGPQSKVRVTLDV